MPDAPHPRDRHVFEGHGRAVADLAEAERGGRLHHAWLIGGPEGIGKATLAYRFARFLLAKDGERLPGGDGLSVDPEGRTARQISAGAHPNLAVLERLAGDGEKSAPKTIAVESVRKALAFFTTTVADGGRRICIVDSAETLTPPAANALLKTIEEPPPRSVVLIVSHAPQRVLATIRSRCRKLALESLTEGEVRGVLRSLAAPGDGIEPRRLDRAASLSDGSVGRALALLDPRRLALLDELEALLATLPEPPLRRVLALSETLADRRSADDLPLALDMMVRWLSGRIGRDRALGPARLAPLAEVCENVVEAARAVEVFNLDRRAFVVSAFGDLAAAVRRSAAPSLHG